MMQPLIFDSVDAMLAHDALSHLLNARVHLVKRQLFSVAHRSANELYEIWVQSDAKLTRLILKRFHPTRDWVMRLTHDTLTREAMLYTNRIYARMPREIQVPVIAAARDGDSWATLMYDVSTELFPANRTLTLHNARRLLDHLAALHAQFWNDASLQNRSLGLSTLEDFLTILSPARVQAEIDTGHSHPVLEMAARGWKDFHASAPRDVQGIIRVFQENPASLLSELQQLPQTLVHGDYKLDNLGIADANDSPNPIESHTIVLDWQDATRGVGAMDLGYFLALNARWLPFSKEDAMEIYRKSSAARGNPISTREVEIGLLAGGALRLLWLMILNQQNDLDWWYDLVRRV